MCITSFSSAAFIRLSSSFFSLGHSSLRQQQQQQEQHRQHNGPSSACPSASALFHRAREGVYVPFNPLSRWIIINGLALRPTARSFTQQLALQCSCVGPHSRSLRCVERIPSRIAFYHPRYAYRAPLLYYPVEKYRPIIAQMLINYNNKPDGAGAGAGNYYRRINFVESRPAVRLHDDNRRLRQARS